MSQVKTDTVFVSNLDTNIGEDEIRTEIFRAPALSVLSVQLNFTREGKSAGTATVRFSSPQQAASAQAEFNGALVDGRAMTVQLVGVPSQPHTVVKVVQPKEKQVVKAAAPKTIVQQQQPQQTRRPTPTISYNQYQRQQAPQYQQPRGASRPIVAPREPRQFVSARPAPRQQQQQQAPVKKTTAPIKKAAAPVKKAAPVAKKVAPKKIAPKKPAPKKVLSAAELDAQLDKYNAARNETKQ